MSPALPIRAGVAQQADSASDELIGALLRYTFRYDGGNVRLLHGRVPDDLDRDFQVPSGTRVLGSVVMGSGLLVLASSSAPPESLRAESIRALTARGWKRFEPMRRGGFVDDAMQGPAILCRDGANVQITASRRSQTSTDLFLHYRDGTGPCEGPPRAVFRQMEEPPRFPTLHAPPGPADARGRCFSRRSGGSGSVGTGTMVAADMSAEQVLRHYGRQVEAEGWRSVTASGQPIAVGTWTRTDSTGTTELRLRVHEFPGPSGLRCHDVQMNVTGRVR